MSTATSITVRVPLKIRRRPGRRAVVMPVPTASAGTAIATRADPALLKALARAFRYQKLLDQGRYASISEMAEGEKIDRGYLGRLLQLTMLAPGIVEDILGGRIPPEISLGSLLSNLADDWSTQGSVAWAHVAAGCVPDSSS
jgi:hypothetical protein